MATNSLKIVEAGPEFLKTAIFYTFTADIPIMMKTVPIRRKWVFGSARTAPVTAPAPGLAARGTRAPS